MGLQGNIQKGGHGAERPFTVPGGSPFAETSAGQVGASGPPPPIKILHCKLLKAKIKIFGHPSNNRQRPADQHINYVINRNGGIDT